MKNEISSKFVGIELAPVELEVTPRSIMNFAASVLDANHRYFDDTTPDGIIAHPMMACALTWSISKNIGSQLQSQAFPTELLRQQVHYSESLIWHRAIKPGDRLVIRGRVSAILPHRSGTHFIVRYDAIDNDDEPVFTELTGALLRGVSCSDEGKKEDQLIWCKDTLTSCANAEVQENLWQAEIALHPLSTYLYDAGADIHFPIHTSRSFAQSVGLPDIIMQGTASLSFAISELIRKEAANNPASVHRLDCHFTGMAFPGNPIKLCLESRHVHKETIDLCWSVNDSTGNPIISRGRLGIRAS